MKTEKRVWVQKLELRDNDAGPPTITGYAAVFDVDSVEMETWTERKFVERVARGAFAESLKSKRDVIANIEHESGINTLGRKNKGTLRLAEDDHGLSVEIDPPDTTRAKDVIELIRRGDISGMSFAFQVEDEEIERTDTMVRRTLTRVRLGDVTVTTSPAYPATSVEVRSVDSWCDTECAETETRMRVPVLKK